MKKAIISLANSNGNYQKAMHRLGQSLIGRFDGDFIGFTSEEEVGAPQHRENPYAFKLYAIEAVLKRGYTQILWLDSSVYAVKDVQPVFDIIQDKGYFMQESGNWIGNWTNDFTLNYFGITRDEAIMMPAYNAGMTGLDFKCPYASEFFDKWKQAMNAGCFVGEWNNADCPDDRFRGHRHDMSSASIIACKMGVEYERGDYYFQYGAPEDKLINDTIVAKLQGL